jgi:hypothetical protein
MMAKRNDRDPASRTAQQRVEQRINGAQDSLPGERDALPEGRLPGVPPDPQGDENRDPPANAPAIPR